MDAGNVLFAMLVIVVAALNVSATARVLHSDFYDRTQKAIQVVMIWLLPVIGAIVCHAMATVDNEPGSGRYADEPDLDCDDDLVSSYGNADLPQDPGGHD